LIEDLHLKRCENTLIGDDMIRGCSGGEKRRTSIAIELLNEPSVLFLDEPTSGLDSATSSSIMKLLLSLAKAGRTVVCTIHQPRSNIFASFDQLMLLVEGQTMYYGNALSAVNHFAEAGFACDTYTNPADYFGKRKAFKFLP
jgi:ATP-binding cassette subfamily G (WHITE) protein 2